MHLPLATVPVACVHRSMNERNQRRAPALAVSMACECECDRTECAATFPITMRDYENLRADGRLFAVSAGHENRDEAIVADRTTYLVVEQLGEPGRSALILDPRTA